MSNFIAMVITAICIKAFGGTMPEGLLNWLILAFVADTLSVAFNQRR